MLVGRSGPSVLRLLKHHYVDDTEAGVFHPAAGKSLGQASQR